MIKLTEIETKLKRNKAELICIYLIFIDNYKC